MLALPRAGSQVGSFVTFQMALIDKQPLASTLTAFELAFRVVPLHMVVEAFAGKEALFAETTFEVRFRVIFLDVVAEVVPIPILLAADLAGVLLLHVAALQVYGSRCRILETGIAFWTIVRLLRVMASVDVLQEHLLQLIALLGPQTELAGVTNGQLRASGFFEVQLQLLLLVHKNLYGINGSVWWCFG